MAESTIQETLKKNIGMWATVRFGETGLMTRIDAVDDISLVSSYPDNNGHKQSVINIDKIWGVTIWGEEKP